MEAFSLLFFWVFFINRCNRCVCLIYNDIVCEFFRMITRCLKVFSANYQMGKHDLANMVLLTISGGGIKRYILMGGERFLLLGVVSD